MNKVDTERYILKLVNPKLKKLYGNFNIIPEQIDNPDAAIELKSRKKYKIGIEITTVDKQKTLQYLNDNKITQPLEYKQLEDLQNNQSYSKKPMKKILIDFPKEYIFESVFKKEKKYLQYKQNGDYQEIILIAFSSYLKIDLECFKHRHRPWTNFFLSKNNFSFDKVIFVDCIKNDITIIKSSILPFGKSVNIKDMFNEEPLITPKKKK